MGKLGVFDSGLGGLLISKAIREHIPDLDMLYFGDTLHVPYGNRSTQAITTYTQRCMDAMFHKGCQLIVIACHTASAASLRYLQQHYLPKAWPGRNILGIVVPTLEDALSNDAANLGLIATRYTIDSKIYTEELRKIQPDVQLQSLATPLLVPMIENGGDPWIKDVLHTYINSFDLNVMQRFILGCTHYVRLKSVIREILPNHISILSQDLVLPHKLEDYIDRHPEYPLNRNGTSEFYVTDLTHAYQDAAETLYGHNLLIEKETA